MCGIVGYIGYRPVKDVLLEGLKRLEYRGYDSAGIACIEKGKIFCKKTPGRVARLEEALLENGSPQSTIGIGHTRWATHGQPTQENSHPHFDCSGRVSLVHNGVIENYTDLKEYLINKGHRFSSDTDTECVAHLIEDFLIQGRDFSQAIFDALKMIRGAYALVIMDTFDENALYVARNSSPVIIGIGKGEYFVASDPAPLAGNAKEVVYLSDHELAKITRDGMTTTDLDTHPTRFEISELTWTLEQSQKGNFPHFMLKEIFEGPEVIEATYAGRLRPSENLVKLGGLEQVKEQLKRVKRIIIVACGTSYYAGLIGARFFEELAGIPTEVENAAEFCYKNRPLFEDTIVVAISQSGETADTLAALRKAKEKNLLTLGIVNVVGSSISRETDAGVYNHAGPEIGVASTKAFLSQITALFLMATYLSKNQDHQALFNELEKIPGKIRMILAKASEIEAIAKKYQHCRGFFFLGHHYGYPTALEGALKLKEVAYINADGYPAAEIKHGPIALVDKDHGTIGIVAKNGIAEQMRINLSQIKARGGPVIAIATEGDMAICSVADDVFYVPETKEPFEPLLMVVFLQLFAYYVGVALGRDVDKPRNLAKSVTVK